MYEKEIERLKSEDKFVIDDLRLILRILRSEVGCAWDREQTHESIVSGFLEEAYETVEAIETGETDMLCEELGDVLLQIIFHTQIEEEKHSFSFDDIVKGICEKMIVRHPHIFGNVSAKTSDEVIKNWDDIKAQTKEHKTLFDRLDSIAKPMPALMRAQKIISKSKKSGYDTGSEPETQETMSELEAKQAKAIWDLICECHSLGVDAEKVLRRYCDAFIDSVKL